MEDKFQIIVKESGLDAAKADILLKKFQDYFKIAAEWETKARAIIVTDASQTVDMQIARTGRLFLREKRIAIEKARKELKEQSLREGKAIDGIANVLKALIEPIEEYLERQEKFVEFQAAEKAEAERQAALKKEEEDRIAKEKADAEEREKMRLDNERLKKEAAEREKQIAKEKAEIESRNAYERKIAEEKAEKERKALEEKAQAEREKREEAEHKARVEKERLKKQADEKLQKERAEREKLEREKREREDAEKREARVKADLLEAEARASDREKLAKLAVDLVYLKIPKCKSKKSQEITLKVYESLQKLSEYVKAEGGLNGK